MRRGALIGATGLLAPGPAFTAEQSALHPAGVEAAALADLFWVMLAGAVVLWVLLNGAFFYVTQVNRRSFPRRAGEWIIILGVALPAVVLPVLLAYGLTLMADQRAPGAEGGLVAHVTGEQWWWRVAYQTPEGPVISANELRLPVGARTEVKLGARNVIHSFWIPALAGKMDMFPGRETRIALEPTKEGVFRGQCAELCGASHALMAFKVVVMAPDAFKAWLEREAGPAIEPEGEAARRGAAVFFSEGCGACHTVRGTAATGALGPDLTHVGGRLSIGAATLPTTAEAFADWTRHTGDLKPEVAMPAYRHLSDDEAADLATYLLGLK